MPQHQYSTKTTTILMVLFNIFSILLFCSLESVQTDEYKECMKTRTECMYIKLIDHDNKIVTKAPKYAISEVNNMSNIKIIDGDIKDSDIGRYTICYKYNTTNYTSNLIISCYEYLTIFQIIATMIPYVIWFGTSVFLSFICVGLGIEF